MLLSQRCLWTVSLFYEVYVTLARRYRLERGVLQIIDSPLHRGLIYRNTSARIASMRVASIYIILNAYLIQRVEIRDILFSSFCIIHHHRHTVHSPRNHSWRINVTRCQYTPTNSIDFILLCSSSLFRSFSITFRSICSIKFAESFAIQWCFQCF